MATPLSPLPVQGSPLPPMHRHGDPRVVSDKALVMTLEEWADALKNDRYRPFEGYGYWVRGGLYHMVGESSVFSLVPVGATHVAWFWGHR